MHAREALHIERRERGVAIVWIDLPGEPVNLLRESLAVELESVLEELRHDEDVRAAVLASAKPGGFVAGADIEELAACETAADASLLSRRAQEMMTRLEELEIPFVAAIHGPCLGGGLELALACDARVASDERRTRLGQPEVELGLIPGAGATVRLPRTVGLSTALEMMLTGKPLGVARAAAAGLIDAIVPAPLLVDLAAEHAAALAARGKRTALANRVKRMLQASWPSRRVILERARDEARSRTRGNYPAPLRLLDVVQVGLQEGAAAGLAAEAKAFGELAVSEASRNLVWLFLEKKRLDRETPAPARHGEPRAVRRVGVVGAGRTGSGIAYTSASAAGLWVRMKDTEHERVAEGLRGIDALFRRAVTTDRMGEAEARRRRSRIGGTIDYRGFRHCDVVLEAVFEDLELKRRVLREVEELGAGDPQIFASNTSSIPIARIAEASRTPETVVGMHYFSPVHRMPLVEIGVAEKTAPWVVATCVELARRQGKSVICVRDGVGFYTTRVLAAFLNEAYHMVAGGVPIDRIDRALVDFGFPMGPLALTDRVGIPVVAAIAEIVGEAFGDRLVPARVAAKLAEAGREGKRGGRGFYRYGADGKRAGPDPEVHHLLDVEPKPDAIAPDEIAWRCTLALVNEAMRCLEEGVLHDARDGDLGAVLGLGFPPFLGGPFRLIESRGADELLSHLERYHDEVGERFAPAQGLREPPSLFV